MSIRSDLHLQPPSVAIPQLVDAYGGRIFHLALRLCGNRAEAQDLVQEVFLLAFRKWKQFEGRSKPTTWLFTIASRVCRRFHRKRAGEPDHMPSTDELLPSGEPRVAKLESLREGPHEAALRNEAREVVERAISKIPVHFRLPLVLKDLVEFSVAEVAQVLGLKENTVKTRVHRARLYLRRELARGLPSEEAGPPGHPRQVCLDLLRAKQESLDRGVDFPLSSEELCARCKALFETLDIAAEACRAIGKGELPPEVRDSVLSAL